MWWGAIWCLTSDDVREVIHRVGGGGVQGVDRGPAAGFVASFPGVYAFGEGAVPSGLDLSGQPSQTEEGACPADGARPEPRSHGEPGRTVGDAEQGPAAAAGVEVRHSGVPGGHSQHSATRDATSGGGDQLGPQQQVVTGIDALDVLEISRRRPPARHRGVRTGRHSPAQRWPLGEWWPGGVAATWGSDGRLRAPVGAAS